MWIPTESELWEVVCFIGKRTRRNWKELIVKIVFPLMQITTETREKREEREERGQNRAERG